MKKLYGSYEILVETFELLYFINTLVGLSAHSLSAVKLPYKFNQKIWILEYLGYGYYLFFSYKHLTCVFRYFIFILLSNWEFDLSIL